MQTASEVLASVSDMFPDLEDDGVKINSRGMGNDTPLHVLAWRNEVDAAKVLIDAGADVDAIGEMSETPLHVAISMGSLEMVALLLRSGADSDIRSEFEVTAREKATKLGGSMAELFEA